MDIWDCITVPEQSSPNDKGGRTNSLARVPRTSTRGTLTDLIEGLFECGQRLLAQVNLIFAILIGEIDANASQPVGRLCSVFHHQRSDHGVSFLAIDATGFARPCDARCGLFGESFEGCGPWCRRCVYLCPTGNRKGREKNDEGASELHVASV
jgi:hypothetical protein